MLNSSPSSSRGLLRFDIFLIIFFLVLSPSTFILRFDRFVVIFFLVHNFRFFRFFCWLFSDNLNIFHLDS
jgi:hypothetical protein